VRHRLRAFQSKQGSADALRTNRFAASGQPKPR
jgi:hypothetical protein